MLDEKEWPRLHVYKVIICAKNNYLLWIKMLFMCLDIKALGCKDFDMTQA